MNNDTSLRYLEMLQFLPVYPAKKSLSEIRSHLSEYGHLVSDRTIQRDLRKLEGSFGLYCDDRSIPHGWCWMKDAKRVDIAAMDHAEALTLSLAKKYLSSVLPLQHSSRITGLFKRAEAFLNQTQSSDLIKWNDKVRVVPASHEYIGPKIKGDIQQVIYEAVLREKKFSGSYQSRESQKPKKGIYNPLAIISHGVVTRVICTRELKGEADNLIRYLPLHRFKSASPLEDSINIPKEFDLDEYLDKGELNYLYDKEIDLHLEFSPVAGSHLIETPFSKNQSIKIIKNGFIILKAKTPYTETLKRWILGFGDQVRVLGPSHLKKEIQEIHKRSIKQ